MNWIHYLLQVNIYLVVFYGFYKLLLDNETYFLFNRIYLLSSALLSFSIPFLRFEWFTTQPVGQTIYAGAFQVNTYISQMENTPESLAMKVGRIMVLVYLAGILFFTAKTLIQLIKASQAFKKNISGAAFSFFSKKSIDPRLPHLDTINAHEDIHIRQLHTADILLFELVGIINWFNPILYFYKSTIRNIHEYLADEYAANYQGDKETYAMLLLSKSFNIPQNHLNNHFFKQSQLKKRITMLYKEKSKKSALLKYGLSIPLFIMALILSSATLRTNEKIVAISEDIPSTLDNTLAPLTSPFSTFQQGPGKRAKGKIYDFVATDKQPSFRGGMEKFYQYLKHSVKYPKEAVDKNVQGKVFISFIVETNGELTNIHVERKLGAGTDEEAVRVMKASPRWEPGLVKGKPVRVKYNIPISFALDNSKSAMKGKTLGLQIKENNALAVGGETNPLYIVDGEKQENTKLTNLDPNDILSINVLKDKSATEQYGDAGKNGVIIVTTKHKKPADPGKKEN